MPLVFSLTTATVEIFLGDLGVIDLLPSSFIGFPLLSDVVVEMLFYLPACMCCNGLYDIKLDKTNLYC